MTLMEYIDSLSFEEKKGRKLHVYNLYNKPAFYPAFFFTEVKSAKITNKYIKIVVDTIYTK